MSLIGRYIFRQIFSSTLVVMAVLLVIFMGNQFAETLGEAAADALPREAVFTVLGLEFLRYLIGPDSMYADDAIARDTL